MLFFLLDSDIGKLLSCFKMSDKQTEWIENCRRQFCKTMKSKPDAVSGGGECDVFYWDIPALNYSNRSCNFWRLLSVRVGNPMLIGKVHCPPRPQRACNAERTKVQRTLKPFYGLECLYMWQAALRFPCLSWGYSLPGFNGLHFHILCCCVFVEVLPVYKWHKYLESSPGIHQTNWMIPKEALS